MSSLPQNISMCLESEANNGPNMEKDTTDKENIAPERTFEEEDPNDEEANFENDTVKEEEDEEPAPNRVVDINWEERVITPLKDIPPLGYQFSRISQEVRFVEERPLTHFTQFVNGDEELIFYLEMD